MRFHGNLSRRGSLSDIPLKTADERLQDEKPDLSEEHSSATSPSPPSHGTPYQSPSLGSAPLFAEASSSSATLLPSLMDESTTAQMRSAVLKAKQEEMADEDLLLRQQHIQRQQVQQAEVDAQAQAQQFAMFQQHPEYSADSQAALHHHYAGLSAAQPAFHHSAARLSYTPAPELVADALHRAAYERSVNPNPACALLMRNA